MEKRDCTVSMHCEGVTGSGQLVKFTCDPDEKAQALEALKLFRYIGPPVSKQVKLVGHGFYGEYSRFDIVQRKYHGDHGYYVESLEIKDAPDGRCGCVLHEYIVGSGHYFYEFETAEQADAAYECTGWSSPLNTSVEERVKAIAGFKRQVKCGPRLPWFYAVGDQHIAGDIVFPDCIMEDPAYRFGRPFVIRGYDGDLRVSECIGVSVECSPYDSNKLRRVVFFEDGFIWREGEGRPPEPLRGDQLWIHEAILKFERVLAGKLTNFVIEFMNGSNFVGRLKQDVKKNSPGRYWAKIELMDGAILEGEFDFSAEDAKRHASVEAYLRARYSDQRPMKSLNELRRKYRKSWMGVFAPPE